MEKSDQEEKEKTRSSRRRPRKRSSRRSSRARSSAEAEAPAESKETPSEQESAAAGTPAEIAARMAEEAARLAREAVRLAEEAARAAGRKVASSRSKSKRKRAETEPAQKRREEKPPRAEEPEPPAPAPAEEKTETRTPESARKTAGRSRKKAAKKAVKKTASTRVEKPARPIRRELFINAESLETRVALLEDGHLESFQVERNTGERISGNIYRGRIHNLQQSLQAAFVDIGTGKNAFLHYWDMLPRQMDTVEEIFSNEAEGQRGRRPTIEDIPKLFPPGKDVLVQVTKGPIGTKGPRVTTNITLPGRYLVLLPQSPQMGISRKIEDPAERDRLREILRKLAVPKGMGVIVRTVGVERGIRAFQRDLKLLLALWKEIEEKVKTMPVPSCVYREPDLIGRVIRDFLIEDVTRIVIDSKERYEEILEKVRAVRHALADRVVLHDERQPIFERYGIERQIENIFRRRVWLRSGGTIVVDETEAMVAIDVNSGRSRGGKDQSATILETNLEAADEVARQLRLRNVGGLIVVDFIDMKHRADRAAVLKRFRDALKRDRAKTKVLPISMLGLLEMTRQRIEESVQESYFVDCPYCRGRGLVKSPLSMSVEIQRRISEILRRTRSEGREDESVRLKILVHPEVLQRLRKDDEELLEGLEERFRGKLMFRSDSSLHLEEFKILEPDTDKVLVWNGKPDSLNGRDS